MLHMFVNYSCPLNLVRMHSNPPKRVANGFESGWIQMLFEWVFECIPCHNPYYSRSDLFYHSLLNLQIQMVITSLILGIRSSPFDMLQVWALVTSHPESSFWFHVFATIWSDKVDLSSLKHDLETKFFIKSWILMLKTSNKKFHKSRKHPLPAVQTACR